MELSEDEKEILVNIVKNTIRQRLKREAMLMPDTLPPALREKKGAFVTITKRGRLRGCIGYIEAKNPLYRAVSDLAIAAAFEDTRFPPVKSEELEDLSYEISVLSRLEEVMDVNEIKVGAHGLYIVRGFNSGLLLPQVAVEQNWDTPTFLAETCRKAGLPPRAWKDKETKKYIFSAVIFGDNEQKATRK